MAAAAGLLAGLAAVSPGHAQGPALTELETTWLIAAAPVLGLARTQGLPLDIVVQPRSRRGDAPLAMGFVDGRCKLVLTMRGNPDAETGLEAVDAGRVGLLREAMTAHEIGHCWRYVHGDWHTLPAGFIDTGSAPEAASRAAARRAMRQTRREEGFADLVGLAWTAARHPEHYAFVHAWFVDVRDEPVLPGSHHDTLAWLRLASERSAFDPAVSPFEQALRLWRQGLLED